MLVFTHPACLGHDAGPEHPESPARLTAVVEALRAAFTDLLSLIHISEPTRPY